MIKVLHYINQFYAGIGGEEKADYPAELKKGEIMGPGVALKAGLGSEAEIIGTIICGDSYYAENEEKAKEQILKWVKELNPDVFVAGPAFNAGRYGTACGGICEAVQSLLNIPVVTAMYEENPGADMYKNKVYVFPTKNSAAGMKEAIDLVAPFVIKLGKKEAIGSSKKEGFMPGKRINFFATERGSARAVKMLLAKIKGDKFETEYPMPTFDRVEPNKAIKDLSKATIALCTSGGICPKGNPDHIEASNAKRYGEYDITGVMELTSDKYETAHGGYDPVYANANPNRVLPVDVMRDLEKEGKIGKLHNKFYTTVGNGTAVASAKGFAAEYSQKLKADGVDAVIMTST